MDSTFFCTAYNVGFEVILNGWSKLTGGDLSYIYSPSNKIMKEENNRIIEDHFQRFGHNLQRSFSLVREIDIFLYKSILGSHLSRVRQSN